MGRHQLSGAHHPHPAERGKGDGRGDHRERTQDRRRRPLCVLLPGDGEPAEGVPEGMRLGSGSLRKPNTDRGRLCVSPPRPPAAHDAQLLHLADEADPEEERPAGEAERPLPAAHQRQSADRQRHGRGHGGGPAGPQPAIHHAGHLYPCVR